MIKIPTPIICTDNELQESSFEKKEIMMPHHKRKDLDTCYISEICSYLGMNDIDKVDLFG